MEPTAYKGVNSLAAALLGRLAGVLGTNLGGLYLFGSAAAGAFEDGVSDVDLLAVTLEGLTDAQFANLHAMHHALAREYPAWDDRIELLYVSAAGLKAFRTQVPAIAAISPGEPFHWREAEPGRLMNWYDVQEHGVALFGPPPSTFIETISEAEFVESVRGDLANWPAWFEELPRRTGTQSYVVLTMCRAIHACRTGQQASKTQAGVWATRELPEWADLIRTALEWRRTGSGRVQSDAGERTLARIRAFVGYAKQATESQ